MSGRLPVVSGAHLVAALEKLGLSAVRQRGSHVFLRGANGEGVVVPLHREVKRGTLAGILRDAGVSAGDLRAVL